MKRIIDELTAKRADAIKSMQAFRDEAAGEVMSEELFAKFKAAETDFDNCDAQIKSMKTLEAAEKPGTFEDVQKPETVQGFMNYLRTGDKTGVKFENAVGTGAGSAGAIVPNDLYGKIIKTMYDYSAIMEMADVINIGGNTDIPISGTEPTAYWTQENGAFTASEPTIRKVTLSPKKLTSLVLVSEELLEDAAFDVESYIGERTGIAFGRGAEDAFINNSTVTSMPGGIIVSASVGVTASSTGHTFTYGEIVTLYTSVKGPYRRQGSFLASDAALRAIMLLQDGDGHYIFQPSYSEGTPDRVLSKPIKTSEYMSETMAANAMPVLFGDFKQYKVGMRKAMTAQRLVEKYADNGQVGFRFYMRLDGRLVNTSAIKALKLS